MLIELKYGMDSLSHPPGTVIEDILSGHETSGCSPGGGPVIRNGTRRGKKCVIAVAFHRNQELPYFGECMEAFRLSFLPV